MLRGNATFFKNKPLISKLFLLVSVAACGRRQDSVPPMLVLLQWSFHKPLSQILFTASFISFNPARRTAAAHVNIQICSIFVRILLLCLPAPALCHACFPNVTPNPDLLCGDSRYNICKPLPLCRISNGLETSFICSRTPAAGLVYSPPHTPCHT